ncbi:MAG: hypothetical protein HRT94_02540 [Alphaproteobacteria bacterium]|nr:hypothetical protein [Alphaproteobacteria bacterium]
MVKPIKNTSGYDLNEETPDHSIKHEPSPVVLSIDIVGDLSPVEEHLLACNLGLVLCRNFRLAVNSAAFLVQRAAAGEIVELRDDFPEVADTRIINSQELIEQGRGGGAFPRGASIHFYQRLG